MTWEDEGFGPTDAHTCPRCHDYCDQGCLGLCTHFCEPDDSDEPSDDEDDYDPMEYL